MKTKQKNNENWRAEELGDPFGKCPPTADGSPDGRAFADQVVRHLQERLEAVESLAQGEHTPEELAAMDDAPFLNAEQVGKFYRE